MEEGWLVGGVGGEILPYYNNTIFVSCTTRYQVPGILDLYYSNIGYVEAASVYHAFFVLQKAFGEEISAGCLPLQYAQQGSRTLILQ